ncbi:MAG: FecR family protein [Macellibacteroides fermentans]|uniref:FecR family protein n=1 Tax=Macellibacteroides fermentans TaxID=879969 RepID=UPI003AC0C654
MKKIPWNKIISQLKDKSNSKSDSSLENWKVEKSNLQIYEEAESLWNEVQYNASLYNPNKKEGWKKVYDKIYSEAKTISIPIISLYKYATSAAILLLILGIGTYKYIDTGKDSHSVVFKYVSLNGKSKVALPDGTAVWLGPHTEIAYNSNFTSQNRHVSIRGKAYFEVKKDSLHPFTVQIDRSQIKVYGTSFNVNESNENISVSLLSGKISFLSKEKSIPEQIVPGEVITYNKVSEITQIHTADVFFDVIWAQDKLRIEEKNLGDVVKYLNQWYDADINLDPALKDKYKYTFTITNEQLDEVLRMLSRINPMEISYNKNKVLIK